MIERVLEFLAPDCCVICNKEGLCVCQDCLPEALVAKKPSCVLCNALTLAGQICSRCRSKTRLSGVSVSYRYQGVAKELVGRLKYHAQRSVARFFTPHLILPVGTYDLVSWVPSDGKARRARGYNQAELLARQLAKLHGLPCAETLWRQKHVRQVDLGRAERLKNIAGSFVPARRLVTGLKVLLVDDVVTTGATLGECAKVLKAAGATKVWGVVVAKK